MTPLEPNPALEHQIHERVFCVAPNLYRMPITTGYRIGDVNAWLLDGDEPVLFDAGTGSDESMHSLQTALGAVGRRVRDIRHLMLTHAHIDHCGSAGHIAGESGCGVWVHPVEVDRVRDFQTVSRAEIGYLLPQMTMMGFEPSAGEHALAMLDHLSGTAAACPSALALPERLETVHGDITWTHVPGHSAGDVLFRIGDGRFMVTGDHVLPHVATSPALTYQDGPEYAVAVERYRSHLERTGTLDGLIGLPGHGPVFGDVGMRARGLIQTQNIRMDRVGQIIGRIGPCTALDIATALFGRNFRFEILMLTNEAAGYARMLASRGICRIERNPGAPDLIIPLQSAAYCDKAG